MSHLAFAKDQSRHFSLQGLAHLKSDTPASFTAQQVHTVLSHLVRERCPSQLVLPIVPKQNVSMYLGTDESRVLQVSTSTLVPKCHEKSTF